MTQRISAPLRARVRAYARSVASLLSRRGGRTVPQPPGPRAMHHDIPDGETLWLAVDTASTDSLALKDTQTGRLTILPTETDPGTGRLRTARVNLTADGRPSVPVDVAVVTCTSQGTEAAVAFGAPARGIRRIPRTSTGAWRFALVDVAGHLHLRHSTEPPVAWVMGVDATSALEVWFSPPNGAHSGVVALGADGEVVGTVECGADGGLLHLRLDHATFPLSPGEEVALAVDATQQVPLVRRHDDLRAPNSALVMPSLFDEGSDSELHLRYRRDGHLVLKRHRSRSKVTS